MPDPASTPSCPPRIESCVASRTAASRGISLAAGRPHDGDNTSRVELKEELHHEAAGGKGMLGTLIGIGTIDSRTRQTFGSSTGRLQPAEAA